MFTDTTIRRSTLQYARHTITASNRRQPSVHAHAAYAIRNTQTACAARGHHGAELAWRHTIANIQRLAAAPVFGARVDDGTEEAVVRGCLLGGVHGNMVPGVSGVAGDCLLQTLWVLRGHSAADCQHCNVPFIHFNNNLAAAIGA